MDLQDKIRKIEALIAGAKSEGERQAAKLAKMRILGRFMGPKVEKEVEYGVTAGNHWKKKLFVALCAKHGLKHYRYKRQKHTTTMVRVSKSFMDEVLWPEFRKFDALLEELMKDIMDDLIAQIHEVEEEEVVIMGELPVGETRTV